MFHKLKSWLDTEFKSSFAYSNLSLNLSMPLVNHSKNKNTEKKVTPQTPFIPKANYLDVTITLLKVIFKYSNTLK